jgi:hypothetical protein
VCGEPDGGGAAQPAPGRRPSGWCQYRARLAPSVWRTSSRSPGSIGTHSPLAAPSRTRSRRGQASSRRTGSNPRRVAVSSLSASPPLLAAASRYPSRCSAASSTSRLERSSSAINTSGALCGWWSGGAAFTRSPPSHSLCHVADPRVMDLLKPWMRQRTNSSRTEAVPQDVQSQARSLSPGAASREESPDERGRTSPGGGLQNLRSGPIRACSSLP